MTEPLVLHFVGPSGTGKSYLAEIVAKSRHRPVSCKPNHDKITEGGMAAAGAAIGAKLGLMEVYLGPSPALWVVASWGPFSALERISFSSRHAR